MSGVIEFMGTAYQLSTIRSLIDTHLSLQWCRDNCIVPIKIDSKITPKKSVLILGVANFTYLGTIGDFLKHKIASKGLDCCFIELSIGEIQSLLDQVSDERLFNSQNNENNDYAKIDVIESLSDAAAEEDYVLGAIGWASTKKLPILFVIEDNNYSILTKKDVRRNWAIKDVAKSFKMEAFETNDDPNNIKKFSKYFFKKPCLLNINTNRIYWHAGSGKDSEKTFDRYLHERKKIGINAEKITKLNKTKIKKLWENL